jgi:hypothetical protein
MYGSSIYGIHRANPHDICGGITWPPNEPQAGIWYWAPVPEPCNRTISFMFTIYNSNMNGINEFTYNAIVCEGERFASAIGGMPNRGLALSYACKQINHHL